jgi:hypothetical protein
MYVGDRPMGVEVATIIVGCVVLMMAVVVD